MEDKQTPHRCILDVWVGREHLQSPPIISTETYWLCATKFVSFVFYEFSHLVLITSYLTFDHNSVRHHHLVIALSLLTRLIWRKICDKNLPGTGWEEPSRCVRLGSHLDSLPVYMGKLTFQHRPSHILSCSSYQQADPSFARPLCFSTALSRYPMECRILFPTNIRTIVWHWESHVALEKSSTQGVSNRTLKISFSQKTGHNYSCGPTQWWKWVGFWKGNAWGSIQSKIFSCRKQQDAKRLNIQAVLRIPSKAQLKFLLQFGHTVAKSTE